MLHRALGVARIVAVVSLALSAGCSREPPPPVKPPEPPPYRSPACAWRIDPVAAAQKAIEMYDTNHDGKISGEELDQCPPLKDAIDRIDRTGVKEVTAENLAVRIRVWQASPLANTLIWMGCTVTRNGKPLEGAIVKFVPEKFLGDFLQTAAGLAPSDAKGRVSVTIPIPADEDSGDHLGGETIGLFRIEVTKPGEDIPAKYNTETILGSEFAIDNPKFHDGLKFDLQY